MFGIDLYIMNTIYCAQLNENELQQYSQAASSHIHKLHSHLQTLTICMTQSSGTEVLIALGFKSKRVSHTSFKYRFRLPSKFPHYWETFKAFPQYWKSFKVFPYYWDTSKAVNLQPVYVPPQFTNLPCFKLGHPLQYLVILL